MLSITNQDKLIYEAPTTSVVKVKVEGVICNSQLQSGNSINGWGDGGTIDDTIYM